VGNDYEAVIRSINSGKPVILNGKSLYGRDVKRLVRLVVGKPQDEEMSVSLMHRIASAFRPSKQPQAGSRGREDGRG